MTYTHDMSLIHQVTEAMVDLLTYAQWQRIRFAAERGGLDAGLKALTRVSRQIAEEKIAAANEAAYQQGRLIGLQMALDIRTPAAVEAAPKPLVVHEFPRSKVIESATYDAALRQMHITFRAGTTYRYDRVELSVLQGLLAAESAGTYFARHIRDVYTTHKILGVC